MSGINPAPDILKDPFVLNGIAYDGELSIAVEPSVRGTSVKCHHGVSIPGAANHRPVCAV